MIFNITTQNNSVNVPDEWTTGNKRSDLKFGTTNEGYKAKICDNFFSLDDNSCDPPTSNRWSAGSVIDSSVSDTERSNSNNTPIYFDESIGTNALKANFLYSYLDKVFLPRPTDRINN